MTKTSGEGVRRRPRWRKACEKDSKRCQQLFLARDDLNRWGQLESNTGPQLKGPAAAGQMVLENRGPVILQPQSSPTTATFHGT